jgi:hypothetical protein
MKNNTHMVLYVKKNDRRLFSPKSLQSLGIGSSGTMLVGQALGSTPSTTEKKKKKKEGQINVFFVYALVMPKYAYTSKKAISCGRKTR